MMKKGRRRLRLIFFLSLPLFLTGCIDTPSWDEIIGYREWWGSTTLTVEVLLQYLGEFFVGITGLAVALILIGVALWVINQRRTNREIVAGFAVLVGILLVFTYPLILDALVDRYLFEVISIERFKDMFGWEFPPKGFSALLITFVLLLPGLFQLVILVRLAENIGVLVLSIPAKSYGSIILPIVVWFSIAGGFMFWAVVIEISEGMFGGVTGPVINTLRSIVFLVGTIAVLWFWWHEVPRTGFRIVVSHLRATLDAYVPQGRLDESTARIGSSQPSSSQGTGSHHRYPSRDYSDIEPARVVDGQYQMRNRRQQRQQDLSFGERIYHSTVGSVFARMRGKDRQRGQVAVDREGSGKSMFGRSGQKLLSSGKQDGEVVVSDNSRPGFRRGENLRPGETDGNGTPPGSDVAHPAQTGPGFNRGSLNGRPVQPFDRNVLTSGVKSDRGDSGPGWRSTGSVEDDSSRSHDQSTVEFDRSRLGRSSQRSKRSAEVGVPGSDRSSQKDRSLIERRRPSKSKDSDERGKKADSSQIKQPAEKTRFSRVRRLVQKMTGRGPQETVIVESTKRDPSFWSRSRASSSTQQNQHAAEEVQQKPLRERDVRDRPTPQKDKLVFERAKRSAVHALLSTQTPPSSTPRREPKRDVDRTSGRQSLFNRGNAKQVRTKPTAEVPDGQPKRKNSETEENKIVFRR